eukprot:3941653-Rhodomonas_salina.4
MAHNMLTSRVPVIASVLRKSRINPSIVTSKTRPSIDRSVLLRLRLPLHCAKSKREIKARATAISMHFLPA